MTDIKYRTADVDGFTIFYREAGSVQAYEEGLSDGWSPIRAYWQDASPANREALRAFLKPETTAWQYTHGVPGV
jgi:hypothetical protein